MSQSETQTYNIDSLQQLDRLVEKFLPSLTSKNIIWLQGPLGIGKSEWVRRSLKKLGLNKNVPSPSFNIHHSYVIQNHPVHHLDLYRVRKESDLESIGFFDLFLEEKGSCIFIEWADHIQIHQNFPGWNQLILTFKWNNSNRTVHVQKVVSN